VCGIGFRLAGSRGYMREEDAIQTSLLEWRVFSAVPVIARQGRPCTACRDRVVSEAHCAQPASVGREHERASGLVAQRIARLCGVFSTSSGDSLGLPACR
jgi:hypothetical protein